MSSYFRDHDPELDEQEDFTTDFERWVESWVWTPKAVNVYVSLLLLGLASGIVKFILGSLLVLTTFVAFMVAGTIVDQWMGKH